VIAEGEGEALELKKSLGKRTEALQAFCAMLNADRGEGMVIFGVSPANEIVGVESGNLDSAQLSLVQEIRSSFDPAVISSVQCFTIEGKTVVVLAGSRSPAVPYHEYDGRAWIREGSSKRKLSLEERDQLRRRRDRDSHPGPWKCDNCGSTVQMLVSVIMTDSGVKKNYACTFCGQGEFWPAS